MAAWKISAATSVSFAPQRSATIPVATRPRMEERPEAPSKLAAAIAPTPWSIACDTIWKIGPECAAQHPKCVSAMAQNGHC